jgi:hypothetical protein
MPTKLPRREFLVKASVTCMGGCLLLSGKDLSARILQDDQPIDPEKLCYCGYSCPEDCKFLVASVKDDPELKKAVFVEWDLEERYGLEFDPEKIFCFKCKPLDKPEGPVLTHCTVRKCALEKGYQACIQCDELKDCDKDLWERFPQFHDGVIELQKKYRAQA